MNAQIDLIEGTTRDLSKSQYFTPPELAARVVEWAHLESRTFSTRPARVLEPSAGNGALVRPLVAAGAEVTAVEIDARYTNDLHELLQDSASVNIDNFLSMAFMAGRWDLVLMNPPYENGLDVAFILHALKFAPRVVGIFQAGIEYGVDRYDALWSKVRPTRLMKLKRRWFKDPHTGKGGETNYLVAELVKRESPLFTFPDHCSVEWW